MINSNLIIKKLINAINVYPSIINLKREIREDDGMGGYKILGIEDVVTFNGFLDKTGSSFSISFSEGGKIEKTSKLVLVVPFSEDFKILKNDFFMLDDINYVVVNPNLQFDVCYLAELEVS